MSTLSDSYIHPSTGKCQGCESMVLKDDLLQCETCQLSFHPFCSILVVSGEKQCTRSFLTQFSAKSTRKPNFSWKCDECIISQDAVKKTDLAQIVHSLALKVEALTTTFDDFKQETKQDNMTLANIFDRL